MVKIKEVCVTANYAWSPAGNYPVYIAAGTAAQQLDATFSSNAQLEIYAIDMADTAMVAKSAGKVETTNRFHKVVWGEGGYSDTSLDSGVIVCGTDKGGIEIYNPKSVMSGDDDCVIFSTTNHTGPVRALDFNKFQKNLFASGASESEIFIWDLKSPGNPMTPGKKTQPTSAISSIAWNQQVQHILASTSTLTSGPCCVVWDLRKNEPIIKVQDPAGRMQCIDVAWHPEIATQLVLASEDDHAPVVQLWDLRFATSPMKVLEKHAKGVVSVAWCSRDPDLLLTCGKDNKIYCWNPNSSPPEVVHELETHAQWCFDVQWCPRNPNVISTGSFDGHITIHSLMGGEVPLEQETADDKQRNVAEAFGSLPVAPQQATASKQVNVSVPLKKPPKWMRKPCGATFAFGGKLVIFEDVPASDQQQHIIRRTATINQVITEQKLLERSIHLRQALTSDQQCSEYCKKKLSNASNEFEENFWNFLKVNFEPEPRKQYLHLLGYDPADLEKKFNAVIDGKMVNGDLSGNIEQLSLGAKGEPLNSSLHNSSSNNSLDAFDQISATQQTSPEKPDDEKPMCIPVADEDSKESNEFNLAVPIIGRRMSTLNQLAEDLDSLISQALLIGNYSAAVDLCLRGERMADAIVIAIAGGPELLKKTQKRYFAASQSKISRLLSSVVTKDWHDIIKSCELDNWKEAFASLLTYATSEELLNYCDELGERLEENEKFRTFASLCYVCSGNIDKFVRCWDKLQPSSENNDKNCDSIQDVVEKMLVLLRVVEARKQERITPSFGETAADKLAKYAATIAAQGQLSAAMEILPQASDKMAIQILRDRLFHSQGDQVTGKQPPPFPFTHVDGGQRTETKVQPHRTAQGSYNQQNMFSPQSASMVQPVQPQPSYAPTASKQQQPIIGRQRAANPYVSSQPLQRSPYSAPQQPAPTNIFTPQSIAAAVPPSVAQPAPSMYQPPSSVPVSNGPSVMQPNVSTPPNSLPPTPTDNYGDGIVKHNVGGWNDPPPLDPNRIPKKKKPTPQPFVPESLNLFTPAQPPQVPPGPMQPGAMMNSAVSAMNPMVPSGPMMGVVQNQTPRMQENIPQGMMQNVQQNTAPQPSVPTGAMKDVPKAPIPAEHQVLQNQFDELIQKCQMQTTNPQMKRKLDECSKRLEFLYDKLRVNNLSANVIGGLHQVAQSIASRDYSSGLRFHTQIVSHSNFSEISAFMPGLKSMLQIAGQLRI
ncbi:protein transport protein Sec31A-like isoform X2 [Clavelina lepadiformis]|uniref:protein transport protein Sec31A-like isoform X2 n=1 Tax=Clavelina lepadiformis TaxID=159417 RepID=UPI004041A030